MTTENTDKKLTMKDLDARLAAVEGKVIVIAEDGDLVKRLQAVEIEMSAVTGRVDELPGAVAIEVNAHVLPKIEETLRSSSGRILVVGSGQLVKACGLGIYKGGKAVVLAPVKACRWGYRSTLKLFGLSAEQRAARAARKEELKAAAQTGTVTPDMAAPAPAAG